MPPMGSRSSTGSSSSGRSQERLRMPSLIARCLEHLSLFRLSRQVAALDHVLGR